jgi:diacylglycerol kinase family enzyme
MKKAQLVHNPGAGKQEHSKKELISIIKANGYECGYSSTKKSGWSKDTEQPDFLVVAGGDGTVRRVALKLFEKGEIKKKTPILLLPLGTANNIAKSLGIPGHVEQVVQNMSKNRMQAYDVGRVSGMKKEHIFLESFGYGVFPELMRRMKEIPEREDATPEENLKTALEVLHDIILTTPATAFNITIDGMKHSDNYLMAEVMNSSSIGPNLKLNPASDPGDGLFEVILVPESQREEFAGYVSTKINGIERPFMPVTIKGKNITVEAGAGNLHVDDELLEAKKAKKVKISPDHGLLRFFVQ